MAESAAKAIMAFFGIEKAGDFVKEWKALSATDKEQIRQGIGDGSFTY